MNGLTPEQKEKFWQDICDLSNYELQIPRETALRLLSSTEKLTSILFEMTWSLVLVHPRHGYIITSDNPLALTNEIDGLTTWNLKPGGGNEATIAVFPLTPHLVLLMMARANRPLYTCSRGSVDKINEMIAERSDQYLYADRYDESIMVLAAKYKNRQPNSADGLKHFANVTVADVKVSQ